MSKFEELYEKLTKKIDAVDDMKNYMLSDEDGNEFQIIVFKNKKVNGYITHPKEIRTHLSRFYTLDSDRSRDWKADQISKAALKGAKELKKLANKFKIEEV